MALSGSSHKGTITYRLATVKSKEKKKDPVKQKFGFNISDLCWVSGMF
jgi:hypothetical protein